MSDYTEKDRRIYYQDIVYKVCNLLDKHYGRKLGTGLVCGTIDEPSSEVQNELASLLNEYEPLKAAFTIAIHLLGHADFKNGNTDPSGAIDEGEVHACRLMDKIKELVPRLYANILEGK